MTSSVQVRQHADEADVSREASSKLAAAERRAADLQAEAQRCAGAPLPACVATNFTSHAALVRCSSGCNSWMKSSQTVVTANPPEVRPIRSRELR